MDRVQKLEYEKSMEEYFHTHKVYELIERLLEELKDAFPDAIIVKTK